MDVESKKLHEFLTNIQLERYYSDLVQKFDVSCLEQLEHIQEDDLTSINLTAAERRKFFESVKKLNRRSIFFKLRKSFRIVNTPQSEVTHVPTITSANHGKECIIEEKELTFGNVIGKGAFGYVQKAEWISNTTKTLMSVAVKCVNPSETQTSQKELLQEANAMFLLAHPNLIRLYGVVLTAPFMLVTELAPLGSLSARLKEEPEKFIISNLCSIVIQIAAGMKYLESNRIVHGDMAARNILLISYEKIKVGDFGLAQPLQKGSNFFFMESNNLLPCAWCAPECIKCRKFSSASDVWAFGMTIMEIFSYGVEPWVGLSGSQILQKISQPFYERPERPDHCPKSIYSITRDLCWNHQPEDRADFSMLEKALLKVLPHEVRALNDRKCESTDMLLFKKGDVITVFDNNEEALCRGQNRATLQVAHIPVEFIDLSRGTISDSAGEGNQIFHGRRLSNGIDDRFHRITPDILSTGSPSSLKDKMAMNRESISSISSSPGRHFRLSYCETCSSRISQDSGFYCRCSIHSSGSSKRSSNVSMQSISVQSVSNPIGIPGGNNSMKNHKHNNTRDIYEEFPFDFRTTSLSRSGGSKSTSFRSEVSASKNHSIDSESFYDNIEGLCLNAKSFTTDSRTSLPDIVNPVKQTRILHRRRSLPRTRSKNAKNFENKIYSHEKSIFTEKQRMSFSDKVQENKRSSHEALDTTECMIYDTISNIKGCDSHSAQPYQSHKNSSKQRASNTTSSDEVLYDVLPCPKQNTEEQQKQEGHKYPLYEDIDNLKPVSRNSSLLNEITASLEETNRLFLLNPLVNHSHDTPKPSAPPRVKHHKQKKTNVVDNQAKIKQCVILQSL